MDFTPEIHLGSKLGSKLILLNRTPAQLPVELSENMLQNIFINLPPNSVYHKEIWTRLKLKPRATSILIHLDELEMTLHFSSLRNKLNYGRCAPTSQECIRSRVPSYKAGE